jgi:hypothetical protein
MDDRDHVIARRRALSLIVVLVPLVRRANGSAAPPVEP